MQAEIYISNSNSNSKLALYDKAILKLCNIKYVIRYILFSLIILTGISEVWKAFLSLSKVTSLRISSKVTNGN